MYLQYPQIKSGVRTYINSFKLDSNFIQSGNPAQFVTATFNGLQGTNVFLHRIVKDLEHQYPNGINHPMRAAKEQWFWLKNYTTL